jgi:outer membrane receptor protein involved in Fe transport
MFCLTPQVQYIGERDGYTQRSGNYTLDSYVLLNLIGKFDYDRFSVSISGKNLLDEDYFYPEYIRRISEKVPGGAERHFVGSIRYNF